jgi:hypothetical protein
MNPKLGERCHLSGMPSPSLLMVTWSCRQQECYMGVAEPSRRSIPHTDKPHSGSSRALIVAAVFLLGDHLYVGF